MKIGFGKKTVLNLKEGFVSNINTAKRTLHFEDAATLSYDKLIIATGQ